MDRRLPSALAVLALGLTIVGLGSGRGWMSGNRAGRRDHGDHPFGLLAKARFAGAEIEGLYVALTGIAMACWMAWWTQRRSPWLSWVGPGSFSGLGCSRKVRCISCSFTRSFSQ